MGSNPSHLLKSFLLYEIKGFVWKFKYMQQLKITYCIFYKYCIFTAKYVHEYIISKYVPLCGTGIAPKNGLKEEKNFDEQF